MIFYQVLIKCLYKIFGGIYEKSSVIVRYTEHVS